MTRVFIGHDAGKQEILLLATVRGPREARGHVRRLLRPGETFWGYTYDELLRLAPECDLEPKDEAKSPPPKARA